MNEWADDGPRTRIARLIMEFALLPRGGATVGPTLGQTVDQIITVMAGGAADAALERAAVECERVASMLRSLKAAPK